MSFRVATYNVENLFRRARILQLRDSELVDKLLNLVRQVQKRLDQVTYSDQTKDDVYERTKDLVRYIDFRTDAGSLGEWRKAADGATGFRIFKNCSGRASWLGELVFRDQEFSDVQRQNTGEVIKQIKPDVMCAVEVEGMDVLQSFNSQVLNRLFKQYLMIDSPNDPRHIDVACLTKHVILAAKTHVFDTIKGSKGPVFSRDCLEVMIDIGRKQPFYILCNHFKSQRGSTDDERKKSAAKRRAQAKRVAEILGRFDLKKDWIAVVGDLNEDSSNSLNSLNALFTLKDLVPVVDPDLAAEDRFTYYFKAGKVGERLNQLDYIFVSRALHSRLKSMGFERRGIFEIDKITATFPNPVIPYPTVTTWDTAASDHAGLWAEFDL